MLSVSFLINGYDNERRLKYFESDTSFCVNLFEIPDLQPGLVELVQTESCRNYLTTFSLNVTCPCAIDLISPIFGKI